MADNVVDDESSLYLGSRSSAEADDSVTIRDKKEGGGIGDEG